MQLRNSGLGVMPKPLFIFMLLYLSVKQIYVLAEEKQNLVIYEILVKR